jgi:hypothetical protein
MNHRRYAGLVAGLALVMLAAGTPNAAADAGRRVVSVDLGRSSVSEVAPAEVAAKFVPVVPTRVLDTRVGTGTGVVAPVGPGQTITIDLSALVPADATAIALNVTGTSPTASTYVTVFPAGTTPPLASNLNLVPNQTRPNAVIVAAPADRRISLYNNAGNTHLIADLSGFYTTSSTHGFTSMSPVRALDTRVSGGPLGPGGVRTVDLSGLLPVSASTVTFNLTGTEATGSTFVTAWPTGSPRPLASNLNLTPGETAPNQVTVQLGTNRSVNLYNNIGNTHLIVDVAGYYAAGSGSSYFAIPPERIVDTRFDGFGPLTSDQILVVKPAGLPPTLSGVTFNLTGTEPSTSMYVTSWPGNSDPPLASNLNLVAGQTAPNLVTVGVSLNPEGNPEYWTINSVGSVHLIMDVAGYFA